MSEAGTGKRRVRAICMLSGGLDSQLAVCVLQDQGIEVHGIVFASPFFSLDLARKAAAQIRVPLHELDFTADILELLEHPPHGFGSCMNPCIDCHARMIRRAGEFMQREGFDLICTGEVLNERPMSQNRRSLEVVSRDSGFADFLVRPLSAQHLPETRVEREGLVDRTRLLALEGRSRKPQFALAAKYGLKDIPTPAGGCRLTDPSFCRRLDDLKQHEGLRNVSAVRLLRVGRHFRLGESVKLVLGRNREDNGVIEQSAGPGDRLLRAEAIPGPTGLLSGPATDGQVLQAAALCARYGDSKRDVPVKVRVWSAAGERQVEVVPAVADGSSAPV